MKHHITSILASVALFASAAFAGEPAPKEPIVDTPLPVYEWNVKSYALAVAEDTTGADFGAGISVAGPVTNSGKLELGVEWLEGDDDNYAFTGSWLEYVDVTSDLHLYITVGAKWSSDENWEWSFGTGMGVEYDVTSRLTVFAEGRYNYTDEDETFVSARLGVGWRF